MSTLVHAQWDRLADLTNKVAGDHNYAYALGLLRSSLVSALMDELTDKQGAAVLERVNAHVVRALSNLRNAEQ